MLKTWERIKLLANINKRNNKTVDCLNVDRVEETNPFVISNHLLESEYTGYQLLVI